jgi:putative membrane protein
MSSEPAAEQRLHPLSFLFSLLMQLRQFALPLVVLLFTGRRSDTDLYALVGVVFLAGYSIAQYFTYRYRIEADAIVVRSGVFQRSLRHIPFARIQNVSLHQNVLHRLFKVAEVRLESAGSAKPEAQMRVLRLRDAQALEGQIRAGGPVAPAAAAVAGQAPAPAGERLLLALPLAEVLRHGLVNNRGMLIVGAAFATLTQAGDNLVGKFFGALGSWLSGHAGALHLSVLAIAGAALLLLVAVLVGLRVLGVVWSLLQFHGFRLTEGDGRLSVERGLLTRVRSSLPRHRIQAWSLHEGILHRWLGRRSLRVDSAVVEAGHGDKRALKDLAPIATPEKIDELVLGLLPARSAAPAWPLPGWQPLHPRAWLRRLLAPTLLLVPVALALAAWRSPQALWALALLAPLAWLARNWARHSAWVVGDGMVAARSGWLDRHWRFAETRKLQALELRQSPLDRRFGMATLHFDTAGAGSMDPALAIRYLPEATARRLFDELSAVLR